MSLKARAKPIFVGLFVVFSCLGLARFAFGMILPDMQHELNMNATQAGIVGSANFVGYFIGLFAIARFYAKFGASILISRSLWTQAFSMIAMALSPNYVIAALFFTITGFFGALANIAIMTYIAQIVPAHIKGRSTGIVVAGIGLGIITSGMAVPFFATLFEHPWRVSWAFFAVLIGLIGILAHVILARFPVESTHHQHQSHLSLKTIFTSLPFWQTGIVYFLFGMSAIMFMTFFVAAVSEQWQANTKLSGTFWALLGVSSLFSGPFFGVVSDKLGRYKTLAILFLLQGSAHAFLALGLPMQWLLLSALLFGFSTWAVPSIMTTLSNELFGSMHTARILSLVTLFFGVGQMVGPLLAGITRDLTGSYMLAFSCSTLLLLSAVGISYASQK